jgi:hypothetical protein
VYIARDKLRPLPRNFSSKYYHVIAAEAITPLPPPLYGDAIGPFLRFALTISSGTFDEIATNRPASNILTLMGDETSRIGYWTRLSRLTLPPPPLSPPWRAHLPHDARDLYAARSASA